MLFILAVRPVLCQNTDGTYCPGKYRSPESCPAGFYCKANSYKQPCIAGNYCIAGSATQKPCPAGTFNPDNQANDVSKCRQCPSGSYCPEGLVKPIECPNCLSSNTGSTQLSDCKAESTGSTITCSATGDPHVTTYEGKCCVDILTTGDYIFSRKIQSNKKCLEDFEIIMHTQGLIVSEMEIKFPDKAGLKAIILVTDRKGNAFIKSGITVSVNLFLVMTHNL